MKKYLFLLNFIAISFLSYSNNINVSGVSITGQNTVSDFTLVQFNISWDNSWRTSTLESNWDAAWVFVKWRLKNSTTWNHATLNTTGHTAPAGSTITAPADGKGIFIYRSANGIGTNTWTAAQLRWNYGVDGLLDGDLVEVCVYAVEMVYVPQGAFYAGDGSVTNIRGHFEAGTSGTPFQVTSEASITLGGGTAGSLGNNNNGGTGGLTLVEDFGDISAQTLPAAFPKGTNAFYMMKYEITQEQYAEFLNKLTYTQQATRTAVAPNSAAGTGALTNAPIFRNGIDIQTPGVSTATPASYACNYNENTTYNEPGDGQNIACNFLSWADLAAYLDWSGLRPHTELEYEKACRGGNLSPVPNEYAWGNTIIINGAAGIISDDGFANERTTIPGANAAYGGIFLGPVRVGSFANAATDRQSAGASYYGVMELSSNNYERPVTVGNATGRVFTGINGDGILDAAGNANTINWPGINAIGGGYRGGTFRFPTDNLRVSDRNEASIVLTVRFQDFGGRGARIAP
jgi:formylglycine-generating enzyme required for sulfatase activity